MDDHACTPTVWAPAAAKVEVAVDGQRWPLVPARDGWWAGAEVTITPGSRYAFHLDDGMALPDPRSPSQPDGVHGPSCRVDHDRYQWHDQAWQPPLWQQSVVYELHVGTFSDEGTFAGVIPHLAALRRLGVTHIELMPVVEFPGRRGWGYDGVCLYAPHRSYGGHDALKSLVDACHGAGLAVIIDVVYNHLGPDGNYLPRFGPYFSQRHATPWGPGPNLDGEHSHEVRRFFIDNALMWLRDYHADGLRLDAIDKVGDDSPRHFLVDLRQAVDELSSRTGQPKVLIAESAANDPIYVLPPEQGGYGMDAQWNDDLHHAIHTVFTGETSGYYVDYGNIQHWSKALTDGFVYDGCHSVFFGQARGKPARHLPGHSFLGYLQSHDQVGNRAHGERFHHLLTSGATCQKVAAAFVLLGPFIPMIFMGEEWAAASPFLYFTDHQDPLLRATIKQGRQREFGEHHGAVDVPDPQDLATFRRSKLDWRDRSNPDHAAMLAWYTELLRLRRHVLGSLATSRADLTVAADPHGRWLAMQRGRLLVVASLTRDGTTTPRPMMAGSRILLHAGAPAIADAGRLAFRGIGVLVADQKDEG